MELYQCHRVTEDFDQRNVLWHVKNLHKRIETPQRAKSARVDKLLEFTPLRAQFSRSPDHSQSDELRLTVVAPGNQNGVLRWYLGEAFPNRMIWPPPHHGDVFPEDCLLPGGSLSSDIW